MKTIVIYVLAGLTLLAAQKPGPGRVPPKIGIIHGTVLDSMNRLPVEYVSLSLVNLRTMEITTGGLTDKAGAFYIKDIPLGKYQVVIQFIGYETLKIGPLVLSPRGDGVEQELGTILLVPTTLQMSEVAVEGERPMFSQTVEKKIFNVEQNTLSSGGSALDVLRQVPGVDVDIDGNISVRGNTNVNILIDGKPSTMTSGDSEMLLENIPANNIQDVEVLTNPSVKYDPEGMAGIINIVLKENKFAGLNGNFNLGESSNLGSNVSGQVNLRNEKINLFLNLGTRNDVRDAFGDTYKETFLADTTILDQVISGNRGGSSLLLKSGLEYYWNRWNTLGLTIAANRHRHDHYRRTNTIQTDSTVSQYYRISDHGNQRSSLDYILTYDRKFTNPRRTLSLYLQRATGENIRDDFQQSHYPVGALVTHLDPEQSDLTGLNSKLDFQLDYVHPLSGKNKLEIGVKSSTGSIDTDYQTYFVDDNTTIVDSTRSNHFIFTESIHSGYGLFSKKGDRLGYQIGLRLEQATNRSQLLDTREEFRNPYVSLFPSASFTLGSQKTIQLQASYSKRIKRPSSRQLNPAIFQFDQSSLRMGNPFLKPEYIDITEIGLSTFRHGLSLSATLYYRYVTDKINRYKYTTEDGVTILTYENYDHLRAYGTEFIVTGTLHPSLRIMASTNIYTDETRISGLTDEDLVQTSTGFNSRFTTTWSVRPTTEVMFMVFYRSPRELPFGEMKSMSFSSLSLKQSFLSDRLSLSLRLNDIFDTMGFGFKTWDRYYYQENNRSFDSQIATIALEYRFGNMEDRSRYSRRNRGGERGDEFEIE